MTNRVLADATPHNSRIYNIATFKDRDDWVRLLLAIEGETLSATAKIVGIRIAFHHNVETGQRNHLSHISRTAPA